MGLEKLRANLEGATPGEWRVLYDEEGPPARRIIGGGFEVVTLWGVYDAAEHDAALIAQAPDLARKVLEQAEMLERMVEALAERECEIRAVLALAAYRAMKGGDA